MTSFHNKFKMVVDLTPRQKKIVSAGLGFVLGTLACRPLLKRSYASHKAFREQIRQEREAIWKAAGVIAERARRGDYDTVDEANMDFEFERIRFMEESLD